jgi:hypothetical protein
MKLILWHLNYPRDHPLRYPCLSLVKYPKLLLGYHLGLSSHFISLIIIKMRLLFICLLFIITSYSHWYFF